MPCGGSTRTPPIFVGALRALLLQSLHPLAMAGVADHSDFRDDPWGRLQRTARFLATTTYGTVAQAEQACATVRRVHDRVRGVAPDGRPYDANDPHLLPGCTSPRSTASSPPTSASALAPSIGAERDDYVADVATVAVSPGVPDPPLTVDGRAARRAWPPTAPSWRAPGRAREAARFLLLQPPVPLAARGPYTLLGATAVSLLPWWAKVMLRIPPLPVTETVVIRPAGRALVGADALGARPGLARSGRPALAEATEPSGHTGRVTHQCEPEPGEPSDEARAALEELESGPAFEDRPPAPVPRRRPSSARGSILGAAMLGLREVLEGPQKERIVIQAEVPGEPPDIDRLGLEGGTGRRQPRRRAAARRAEGQRPAATRRSSRLRRRSGRRG